MKKIAIGVVGLGKMGLLHASMLNVMPDVELVALCDKSSLMVKLFKKIFKNTSIKVTDDLKKIPNLTLDAVYVTTPIASHQPIIKDVLSKKIANNIFVEKTLASNYAQASELCQIANQLNSITMVGYMKRFNVVFQKAKSLLAEGSIGEPLSFSAYAYSSDFLDTKDANLAASRGGPVRDLGCHVIDLAFFLFGDLELKATNCVDNSFELNAATKSGLMGQFKISQSMPNYRMPEFGISINGTKGVIQVNDDRLLLTQGNAPPKKWFRHDLQDNVYFSMGEAEYYRENRQFIDALLSKKKCTPNFDSAAKVDLFIEKILSR
jgi:predicted dehydrogenase